MPRLPWVIKYRPKRVDDVVNQSEAKAVALKWIKSWVAGNPVKKAALFNGPPGCGKTSLVEALANEFGYELIEMNASDYRRATDIERIAKVAATQRGLTGRGKLILLDEVDGLSRLADEGAIQAILDLIKITKNPVVMTANNAWEQKLKPIRDASLLVNFRRLTKTDVKKVLRRICELERIRCDEDAINFIAERAEGDLRSAINDLEAVAEGFGRVTLKICKAVLRYRDRVYAPYEVVRKIFISKYAWQARQAASQTDLSPDELMQWINENLPLQITDPEDLWRAYEKLSRADVFFGRIVKSGSWDLLPYAIELMTAGVALSIVNDPKARYKWVKYQFPQKILLMSRTKEMRQLRERVAEVIGRHILASKRKVKNDVLPYIKIIFDRNPEYAARLAAGLNLDEHMIKYLSPQNAAIISKMAAEIWRETAREALKKHAQPAKEVKEEARLPEEQQGIKGGVTEKKPKKRRKRKEIKGKGLDAFFKK